MGPVDNAQTRARDATLVIIVAKGASCGATKPQFPGTVVSAPEFTSSAWKKTVAGRRVECPEHEADFDRVDILWAMLPGAKHHLQNFQPSHHADVVAAVDAHIGKTQDGIQIEVMSQLHPRHGHGLRRVIFHVMAARKELVLEVVREKRRRALSGRRATGSARQQTTRRERR